MTRLHLTWSLERSPVKSRLSRVPWSRSPRAPPIGASYTGVLLAALSIGSSAGCTRRTASPVRLFFCSSADAGTDKSVLYPESRLTPVGSCTGHEVLALVRPVVPSSLALSSKRARHGGVFGSFCRSVLKPQLLAGCCPSVPSLAPSLTPSDS